MCGPIVRAVKESIHNGSDNWSMWIDRPFDKLADIFWDDIYNARWPESREWIRMKS